MTYAERLIAEIEALLAKQEPRIEKAFLQAIYDARGAVDLEAVIAALERGDIEAAARSLDIAAMLFAPMDQEIGTAYVQSGNLSMNSLMSTAPRSLAAVVRFDGRRLEVEQWLRWHSSTLITGEIIPDQREGIREALRAGMQSGRNPRSVALDVVGRYDKVEKRRTGGMLGLTTPQMQFVENMREELRSGDPKRMRNYLTRGRRDRRFDPIVQKAIKEGRPVPETNITKMAMRYSDRLLELRGQTIARTEALEAFSHAQWQSIRQLVETGKITEDQVEKIWSATLDQRTRDSHVALHNHRCGMNEFFTSPITGNRMRYPRDRELGAGAEDIINCRCWMIPRINWIVGPR